MGTLFIRQMHVPQNISTTYHVIYLDSFRNFGLVHHQCEHECRFAAGLSKEQAQRSQSWNHRETPHF